jgi:hypothetical protein
MLERLVSYELEVIWKEAIVTVSQNSQRNRNSNGKSQLAKSVSLLRFESIVPE